jgi:hypothetical protein
MTVRASFTLTGLDKYLEDLAAAAVDVDAVIAEVLEETAPIAEDEMHTNLRKSSELWTGATAATLYSTNAQQDGNFTFIEFGADTLKDPAGFYKEYGTARQAAEPFLRPALSSHRLKNALRNAMKTIMQRFGL